MKSQTRSNSGHIPPLTSELPALVKSSARKNVVGTIASSVLVGSSSKLQITRIGIKYRLSMTLGQIRLFALELLALERQKISH